MVDRSVERYEHEKSIRADEKLDDAAKEDQIAAYRKETSRAIAREGRFHLPPWGFSIEGAKDLFRMTGDFKD